VTSQDQPDITSLLGAWNDGDGEALNRLVDLLYPRLLRIARRHLGPRAGDSVEPAALADEAYLKLARAGGIRCEDRTHFLALCSQIMRRILVDHARRRGSPKRGGHLLWVALDEALMTAEARGVDILALHEALEELARLDARQSRVVELRYFGGLHAEETAVILGVSLGTVKRDWRLARAWLFGRLGGNRGRTGG
jgi:RNA polymerase sigma factor (TIGR02999 family)